MPIIYVSQSSIILLNICFRLSVNIYPKNIKNNIPKTEAWT